MPSPDPMEVDVRPLIRAGRAPLGAILDAVDRLEPGQPLRILVPFEPIQLYGLLAQRGFSHTSRCKNGEYWEIVFQPSDPML